MRTSARIRDAEYPRPAVGSGNHAADEDIYVDDGDTEGSVLGEGHAADR